MEKAMAFLKANALLKVTTPLRKVMDRFSLVLTEVVLLVVLLVLDWRQGMTQLKSKIIWRKPWSLSLTQRDLLLHKVNC